MYVYLNSVLIIVFQRVPVIQYHIQILQPLSALMAIENLGYWALLLLGSVLAIVIVIKWMQRVRFLKQLRLARIS